MSTIDEIQKLCEQYISRRFGKREKRLLQDFLRDIAVQGKEDEEEPEVPHFQRKPSSHQVSKPAEDDKEKPEIVGKIPEGSFLHQKASQYTQVIQPKHSDPKTVPVALSDLDVAGMSERKQKWAEVVASDNTVKKKTDPEEAGYKGANEDVKGLLKNWETGLVASTVNVKKTDPENAAYKVSDAEDVKKRLQSWETGQVAGQVAVRKTDPASADYKVADLDPEEVKKRKQAWESGQVATSAPIKKTDPEAADYKVSGSEDIKDRQQKWETGQGLTGTTSKKPEVDVSDLGYKVDDSEDVKKRLQSWETGQVAGATQVKKTDPEGAAYKVSDADVKSRLQNWEAGKVATAGEVKKTESDMPQGDHAGVKDRLNKWSEVTKEPSKSSERKQPITLPDKNPTLEDHKDVKQAHLHENEDGDEHRGGKTSAKEDEEARIEREMKEAMAAEGNLDIEVEIEN